MSRKIAYVWVYLLPLPVFTAMYFVWLSASGNLAFTLYVLLLPLLYGYISPGIATNLLKMWRFKGPGVVGNYYVHHGFMYSANMSPLLYLTFDVRTPHSLDIAEFLRIAVVTGAVQGFVLWIHDILIVRADLVEIDNRPTRERRSPEEIVTFYAPVCFFLIGFCYAVSAMIAYQQFVIEGRTEMRDLLWVWLGASSFLFILPGIAYFFLERKK